MRLALASLYAFFTAPKRLKAPLLKWGKRHSDAALHSSRSMHIYRSETTDKGQKGILEKLERLERLGGE